MHSQPRQRGLDSLGPAAMPHTWGGLSQGEGSRELGIGSWVIAETYADQHTCLSLCAKCPTPDCLLPTLHSFSSLLRGLLCVSLRHVRLGPGIELLQFRHHRRREQPQIALGLGPGHAGVAEDADVAAGGDPQCNRSKNQHPSSSPCEGTFRPSSAGFQRKTCPKDTKCRAFGASCAGSPIFDTPESACSVVDDGK